MTLLRRPDGTYEADVQARGVRVHLSLRTTRKGEAQDRHDALRALVRSEHADVLARLRSGVLDIGAVTAAHASGRGFASLAAPTQTIAPWPTLAEAVREYLEDADRNPRRADATVRQARTVLAHIVAAFGPETPVDQLDPDRAEAWVRSLTGTTWRIAQFPIRIRALYHWLNKREAKAARRAKRPARVLEAPVDAELIPPRPAGRDVFLSREQATALIEATPPSFLAAVGLGLFAGLRMGETLALRVSDVRDGVVAVVEKPHWVPGRKPWRPKGKKERRIVVGTWLAEVLAAHVGSRTSGWLFPAGRRHDHPRDVEWLRRQFQLCVERAKLPYGQQRADGITYHTLRHTFAAQHVMAGTDLFTLSELLGHADIRMLRQTYGHLSPDHRAQTAARLESALNPPRNHTGTR